ncbi:MAG: hypothetical protein Q7R81_05910 [Candidatus Peregrinibacteria bacterium]|nr:hypothetical protein [Candidatus Peregrinibacteria bacterium]
MSVDSALRPLPVTEGTQGVTPSKRALIIARNGEYNDVLEREDRLLSLLAHIRWVILQLSRSRYAERTGVRSDLVEQSENDRFSPHATHLSREVYSAFVRLWNGTEVPQEFVRAVIDEMLGDQRRTVYGLFEEFELRMGPHKVEERTGVSLPALRERRDQGHLTPFRDLNRVLCSFPPREHGVDVSLVRSVWVTEARSILEGKRSVPPVLAELHIRDQLSTRPKLTRARTRLAPSTRRTPEFELARFKMPSWDKALPVLTKIVGQQGAQKLRERYEKAYAMEQVRPQFFVALREKQRQRGISDGMMKTILQAEGRPSSFLRDPALEGKELLNETAPPAVLAHVVAEMPEEAEELIACFREERTLYRKRLGTDSAGHPLRLDREQWGVSKRSLIAIINDVREDGSEEVNTALAQCKEMDPPLTERDITLFENCQGAEERISNEVAEALSIIVHHLGMTKAHEAIAIRDSFSKPSTVKEAITRLSERAGARISTEFRQLSDAVRATLPEYIGPMFASKHHMRRFAEGIEVPSWPLLEHIVKCMGGEMTDALRADWRDRYTEQLAGTIAVPKGRKAPKLHPTPKRLLKPRALEPLARVLHLTMEELEHNMRQFSDRRFGGSASAPDMVAYCLRDCNATAKALESGREEQKEWKDLWPQIERILLAADIAKGTPRWEFVHCLYKAKQDVPAALCQWREILRAQGLDPEEHDESLAGLLPAERGDE